MHDCPNRSFRHMQPAVFPNFINMMKRIFFSCLLALLVSVNLQANEDTRAQSILSKAATAYQKSGGISIRFGGSQQGTLALKGTCFYLECGGVKSWFDGTTQWSYVEQNEEVTVSTPSPDELQSINPYALINSYNRLFHCRYGGKHTIRGKEGNEIILTPRQKGDIESVVLFLSETISLSISPSNWPVDKPKNSAYSTIRPECPIPTTHSVSMRKNTHRRK